MRYIDEFLSLNCAGDILNAIGTKMRKPAKEIAEAMAVQKYVKGLTLERPMEYDLYDFCSGNCMSVLLNHFVLPIKRSYAIDIKPNHVRPAVDRFEYIQTDIKDFNKDGISYCQDPCIITGVHPCGTLSKNIITIYHNTPKARHLILMPCCIGKINKKYSQFLFEELGSYKMWCLHLSDLANGVVANFDKNSITSCNGIIIASKD